MVWLYVLLAITAGAMLPFQYGINAQLSHWLSSPVRAAFVSFLVGTLVLLLLSVLVRKPVPGAAKLGAVPWWVWLGGLLGAYYVTGSIFTAPKLGAVTLTAAVVFGQAVASALIDQFGWVGFKEHHLTPGRGLGIVLVGLGIALVRLF